MSRTNKKSGSNAQFPVRLHDMMTFVENQGLEFAIGWVFGGRGFVVYDHIKLANILPLFFGKTKYKSFLRQLNMWDFERIAHGPHRGTYMHPYFVQGNRELCGQMSRQIKQRTAARPSLTNRRPVEVKLLDGDPGSAKTDIMQHYRRLNSGKATSASADVIGFSKSMITSSINKDDIVVKESTKNIARTRSALDNSNILFAPQNSQFLGVPDMESALFMQPSRDTTTPTVQNETGPSSPLSSTMTANHDAAADMLSEFAYLFNEEDYLGKKTTIYSNPGETFREECHLESAAKAEEEVFDALLQSYFAGKRFFLVDGDDFSS